MNQDNEEYMIADALSSVIDGFMDQIRGDRAKNADLISSDEIRKGLMYLREGDLDAFSALVCYPLDAAIEGLVDSVIPANANHRAAFFVINYDYFSHHFTKLITKYEGSACCADKSRTVLRGVLRYLVSGDRIVFNYDGEYTYHLPKKIFREHEQIMELFDALYFFYFGDSTKYISFMSKFLMSVGVDDVGE